MHLFETTPAIGELQRRFSLSDTEISENILASTLLNPADKSEFFRWPAEQRPMLVVDKGRRRH